MPHDSLTPASRDHLLNEILVAILRVVELGDSPDWQTLVQQHPEMRKDLARFFAGLSALMWMVAPETPSPASAPEDPKK